MIYSGNRKWTAPLQLKNLIRKDIPEKYIPGLKFYPVCINEFKTENLAKIKSTLSAAMIAENTDADSIEDHFKIIGNIMREESPDLMQNFSDFLLNLFDKTLETEYIYKEIDKFTPEDGMSIFTESFKRKEKEARKLGIKEGIKEGISKGIEKGIEEGKLEDARRMLAEGCDLSFISKITGLSRRKISDLKKK